MARPQKCRCICSKPRIRHYVPQQALPNEWIQLGYDEYETIRLIDYESYTQEQCAEKMCVARTTVTRMYLNARRKLADALVNAKGLEITGGDVIVCTKVKPECHANIHCCHRIKEENDR